MNPSLDPVPLKKICECCKEKKEIPINQNWCWNCIEGKEAYEQDSAEEYYDMERHR